MVNYEVNIYLDMVSSDGDQPHYKTEIAAIDTATVRGIIDLMLKREFFEIETKYSEFVLIASKRVSEVIVKIKEDK